MKTLISLIIGLLSFVSTPTLAATFVCPQPQALPASLNLKPLPAPQPQLVLIQKYLNNLKAVANKYESSDRFPMRQQQLARCMVKQVESLYLNNSLQSPVTRADGSTWFLIYNEVVSALQVIKPRDYRHLPRLDTVNAWLSTRPQYAPSSPYAAARNLASR